MLECLSPESLRLRASGKWVDFDEDIVPSNPAEMDFAVAPVHSRSCARGCRSSAVWLFFPWAEWP